MKKYDKEFKKETVKKYLDGQSVASISSKNFYYPKVQKTENAEVIEVKEGETKNISLKF